jgi:hypothetical protein
VKPLQSARKKGWIGWAIEVLGGTLGLLVALSLIHQPYRIRSGILAFCLIFLGSTIKLMAAREERKAKNST